jgi:5'-methylthioadenosine phosphorylase
VAALGVILGSNVIAPGGDEIVAAAERGGAVVLPRHGAAGAYRLPHRIDHEANLRWLAERGCDRVLAVCSVGSLDAESIPVGSIVCPHDFIALQLTLTSLDDARAHATPGFDLGWRAQLVAARGRAGEGELRDGGVYWQVNGPRFETEAEIRMIAPHADLVGMTMASECIVAGELGLRYAAICVVDNLANGIAPEPLSPEELQRDRAANVARLRDALAALVPELA